MKNLAFILLVLLILAQQVVFASWSSKRDTEIVYLSTECTNDEAATFTIAINEDECFMYIEFQSIRLTVGDTKIECKFDNKNPIIIIGQNSEKETILFSSARGDKDAEQFISNLYASKELSVRINDEKKVPCIFTFDMSSLQEEVQRISML